MIVVLDIVNTPMPLIVNVPAPVPGPDTKKPPSASVPPVTARFPEIEVAAPNVVVPADIVKLLKLLNGVAGIVLVAANCTVPVPLVKVLVPVPLNAKPLQIKVPPDVIVIVPGRLPEELPKLTVPPTVNCEPLLKSKIAAVVAVLVPIRKEVHTALFISTVTVIPSLMVTAVPATGIAEPPHVAVLLQLPLTDATPTAPKICHGINENRTTIKMLAEVTNFLSIILGNF